MRYYFVEILKALRPMGAITMLCLVLAGFDIGQDGNKLALLCAFVAMADYVAICLGNNYVDRFHDALEGNDFALKHPKLMLSLTYVWSILAFGSSVFLAFANIKFALLEVVLLAIGLAYSFSRKILFLPQVLVALEMSALFLFPCLDGHYKEKLLCWMGGVFFLMLARENIKDCYQAIIDL